MKKIILFLVINLLSFTNNNEIYIYVYSNVFNNYFFDKDNGYFLDYKINNNKFGKVFPLENNKDNEIISKRFYITDKSKLIYFKILIPSDEEKSKFYLELNQNIKMDKENFFKIKKEMNIEITLPENIFNKIKNKIKEIDNISEKKYNEDYSKLITYISPGTVCFYENMFGIKTQKSELIYSQKAITNLLAEKNEIYLLSKEIEKIIEDYIIEIELL